jgi:hypothetical protein
VLIFCYRNKAGKNKIASEVLIVSSHYCNSMQKKGNDGFTNSFAGDSSTQCCGSRMIFFGSDPGFFFSESFVYDPGSYSKSGIWTLKAIIPLNFYISTKNFINVYSFFRLQR